MKSTSRCRAGKAFTLVEMLVVITIIAILAAISFGGFTAAMKAVKKAQDLSLCTNMANAVNMYRTEYSVLPISKSNPSTDTDGEVNNASDWVDLASVLNGMKNPYDQADYTSTLKLNPRHIAFMTFRKADVSAGATLAKGCPKSAFKSGATEQNFFAKMDADYSGVIDDVPDLQTQSTKFKMAGDVAIWSKCDNFTGTVDQKRWTGTQK